jgi:molecular chaperone GrpE (heat shock protein)
MTIGDWISRIAQFALAASSLGALSALFLIPRNRRRLRAGTARDDAEAVKLLTGATTDAVVQLREQVKTADEIRQQLHDVREQLDETESKARRLIADLDAANLRARVAEERAAIAEAEVVRLTAESMALHDELARRRQARRRHDPPVPPAETGTP